MKAAPLLISLLFLSACGEETDAPVQAERISLEAARARPAEPLASPDTEGASWHVRGDGQAIDFKAAEAPLLSLECDLRATPVRLTVVRHAPARPGQKALFPVIGNGKVSRFKVDAMLEGGEWRWQGTLPAADPQLDVFAGPLDLEATLPGGGTLLIEGSRIPGEFVTWCRSGGKAPAAKEETEDDASSDPPVR